MTGPSVHLNAVRELAGQGLTDPVIANKLGIARTTVMRIRHRNNIPGNTRIRQPRPLADVITGYTQPTDHGHAQWTGPHHPDGTPIFFNAGRQHSAYRIAFTLRTGREPEGRVQPDCGRPGCVTPGHLTDRTERQHIRQQLRALDGLPAIPSETCGKGHDQTTDGRIGPDGSTYCNTCADTRKARQRKQVHA
jgi:hypothetical protein